jgi:hypothetical protein
MEKQPICPHLLAWRQLYATLEEAYRQSGSAGMPPPPPSYNMQAWELSSDAHKQRRWADTKAWAEQYGFYHFISELGPDDYYDGD